jgi:FtsZ-binding cell division protein ZapB
MQRGPGIAAALTVCLLAASLSCDAHAQEAAADLDQVDLSSMTAAELAELEAVLQGEVADSDRALQALRADTKQLREEQEAIDRDAAQLGEAREVEARRKAERDQELEQAKADVQAKQASIARMSVRVTELKEQIAALEGKLHELAREKDETERRYNDPSLADVLDSRAAQWGSVPRNVYNKTMHDIVPALSGLSEYASQYRRQVSDASRALELFASLLVYGFVCFSVVATYKVYARVRGNLTVDRILFLGDAFCAAFWTVILVCFMFLFDDPLRVIQLRSPKLFFAFQLSAISSYAAYVLLRVLVLASHMSLHALGEVLAVIVVGQHYYVRVWQPAILDQKFSGTFFYYLCYAWLFAGLAFLRVDNWSPLKQLKGHRLPAVASLRIFYARMTGRSIPDGDLQAQLDPGLAAVEAEAGGHLRDAGHVN